MNEGEQLLEKFYRKNYDNYVPIILAYKSLDLNPNSSTTNRTVSSLMDYGVIEDEGVKEDKKVKITNLGIQLIKENRESRVMELRRKIVLNDEMMSTVFEKFKQSLPGEEAMMSVLTLDLGFTDRAAVRFIKVIRENYAYADLENYNPLAKNGKLISPESELPFEEPKPEKEKEKEQSKNYDYREKDRQLMKFPIPVNGGKQFAYIILPSKLTQKDAELIQNAVKMYSEYFVKENDDDIPF
jgi:hypothetical protein